jgi:hypothetical protein
MQFCVNDVIVNNLPKFLAIDLTDQIHALTIKDPNDPLQPVILPLILRGGLLLNVKPVTINEFNSHEYPRLHLISETLTWDPSTTLFEEQETAMTNYSGNIVCDATVRRPFLTLIVNEIHSLTTDMADAMHNCNFHQVLMSCIFISSVDTSLNGHVWPCKTAPIDFKSHAARWMLSPERAKQTVQLTTQRGVCTCLNPMLAQQYLTNDQMLCYERLPHETITDTLFAGTPSSN